MVNVSGQSLDSLIHQQDLMVEKDWVFVLKVSFALATPVFFIYVNCIMLFTLYSKASFRETSRYILFAHMLFNDSILLLTSVLLYILALAFQHIMRGLVYSMALNTTKSNVSTTAEELQGTHAIANFQMAFSQTLVCVFLYVNCAMIFTFFKKEAFRENTRYILFAYMLVVDTMQLALVDLAVVIVYCRIFPPD
ncbi:UNVERIFIED_CONTAM: hypothetical protein FKN15_001127 [Acipenser sinensis]